MKIVKKTRFASSRPCKNAPPVPRPLHSQVHGVDECSVQQHPGGQRPPGGTHGRQAENQKSHGDQIHGIVPVVSHEPRIVEFPLEPLQPRQVGELRVVHLLADVRAAAS